MFSSCDDEINLILGILFLFSVVTASAHPGIGIVQDRHGCVFFTDTKQVCKIAPDDTMSVAVPGVHTHELCLDANGNLYGEHLWYEGDASKRWGHRVWRWLLEFDSAHAVRARRLDHGGGERVFNALFPFHPTK